ncbi:DMT family transporter [Candidatus Bathyarchaeota archaeon]|nr:DMT family transporter [Candidatus Bathyarchaeota archaeon]MBS7629241.1 DMT family transporter [Candidatus Bathyarchaeota archaeon]
MYGEVLAVIAAILWAASMVSAVGTLKDVDPLCANTMKILFGASSMLPIALIMSRSGDLFNFDITGVFFVIVAAMVGIGLGDTCLLKSTTYIGISRSYTIAYSYPIFTMFLANLFLGEPFHYRYLVGSILIFLGVANALSARSVGVGDRRRVGLMYSLAASLSWALGTVLVTQGVKSVNIVLANTIRYPIVFLTLLPVMVSRGGRMGLNRRDLGLLVFSGILGMTLGGIIFLHSVQLIGASKAAPLSSSSPFWASILSSVFLKEKLTLRILASTILVIAGIFFLF